MSEPKLTPTEADVKQLVEALVVAAMPLEVIAAQAAECPYDELTLEFQENIVHRVIPVIRAALAKARGEA